MSTTAVIVSGQKWSLPNAIPVEGTGTKSPFCAEIEKKLKKKKKKKNNSRLQQSVLNKSSVCHYWCYSQFVRWNSFICDTSPLRLRKHGPGKHQDRISHWIYEQEEWLHMITMITFVD